MASNNYDEGDKNFDDLFEFTNRLIPDPANTNFKKIKGFAMGKSDKDGYWRLYFDSAFTHFLEFKKRRYCLCSTRTVWQYYGLAESRSGGKGNVIANW